MSEQGDAAGPRRTTKRVRALTAANIGVSLPPVSVPPESPESAGAIDDLPAFEEGDELLNVTRDLLEDYGGVVFVGAPGTSKSWYAARVARELADGHPSRMRFVQFHPSYQYEDFVQGFVPLEDGGGFRLEPKHLLRMARAASKDRDNIYVLVIDELSRGEPGRIFGEALTYVEATKRDFPFHLASGEEASIPPNLVFLATMNPQDRGVDEVDAAFERRFAKYALDPDPGQVSEFLVQADMEEALRARVVQFFRSVNRKAEANPLAALGHTYFIGIADEADLRRLWNHQLRFLFEKAFRLDREGFFDVEREWERVLRVRSDEGDGSESATDRA